MASGATLDLSGNLFWHEIPAEWGTNYTIDLNILDLSGNRLEGRKLDLPLSVGVSAVNLPGSFVLDIGCQGRQVSGQ